MFAANGFRCPLTQVAERAHQTIPAAERRTVPICTIEEDVYVQR